MASTTANIKATITAEDHASKTIQGVGMSFGKMAASVAAGQAIFAGATAAISKLESSLKDSVDTTVQWTRGTIKLQRELGVTSETASGLQAVGKRFGLTVDDLSKSFGIFAKQVTGAAQGSKEAIENFAHFGISVKDVHGNIKDFNTLFGETADKFKNAPNGFDKTAEAMRLFGRSGKDMLPILNLGSQGIKDLTEKAQKYGLILTQDNVAAVKKYIGAQKDMDMAMQGLKIQIGNALLPALADLANRFAGFVSSDKFQEWLKKVTDWLKNELPKVIAKINDEIIPKVVQAFKDAKDALDKLNGAFNWLSGWVKDHKDELLLFFGTWAGILTATLIPALIGTTVALTGMTIATVAAFAPIIAIGYAIYWVVQQVQQHWEAIKAKFHEGVEWIKAKFNNLKENFAGAIGYMIGFMATLPIKLPFYAALAISKILSIIASVRWSDVFAGIWWAMQGVWDRVSQMAVNAWHGIMNINWGAALSGIGKSLANSIIGLVEGAINGALSGLPTSPSVHLPRFAAGTNFAPGGAALVGERGPEIVNLPRGSQVIPNNQIGSMGGNVSINVNVGMYAGSEIEKRKVATALFEALKDVAGAQNTSVGRMLGL